MPRAAAVVKEVESDIQRNIRDFLRYKGWMVWKNHQSLGSTPGVPDLQAVKAGLTIYVEVKTSRGQLTAAQEEFRRQLEAHGAVFILARSIKDVEDALEREGLV